MGTDDRSRTVLIAIGVVVAVLVGVAVVIALQPPAVLDPATPEGTAQGYFQALHDGDDDLVISYLTEDLIERCDEFGYLEELSHYEENESIGVSILGTEIDNDEVKVEVAITVTYEGDPFETVSDRFEETLVMERHGDRWLISRPPWPWDSHFCDRES
jgi:hypothetical protein